MTGDDYQYPDQGYDYEQDWGDDAPLKHSGLGISSIIVGGVGGLIVVIGIVVAGIIATNDPYASEEDPGMIMAGCGMLFGLLLNLIGLGLGIAGVCFKTRKKATGIVGLTLNGIVVLLVCGLMAIGAVMGP